MDKAVGFDFGLFAALAFVLGFKHAFDVDHVVAVSNILTRQASLETSLRLATSWAAGHMLTAAAVSALLFYFADTLAPRIVGHLEILVPFMLILIGLLGLAGALRRLHFHRHAHGAEESQHRHIHFHVQSHHEHGAMAGIGVIHGLASNDELLAVLLIGLGASAWWQVLAGVAVFSLGVVAGMVLYAAVVHAATRAGTPSWVPDAATLGFSVLSIVYAIYLLAGGNGMNLVPNWLAPG